MFAFSQVEPDTGVVQKPQIPLGRFLGAAWDQGLHDSMAGSLYRISEQFQLEHDVSFWGLLDQQAGRKLTAEEANAQYGDQQLRFSEPVYEGMARLMRERQDANKQREYLLANGNDSWTRLGLAFGASMLASLANPVDFATMFIPIVGEEAAAGKLAALGAGRVRQMLARGIVTEERLAGAVGVKALTPKVMAAAIEGSVGQTIAEIPLYISNRMDQTPYTLADSAVNIALGGAFAVSLRLGLEGAARLLRKASRETKEAAFQKALSDTLLGKDVDVGRIVEVDPHVIRERVIFDEVSAHAKAAQEVDAGMSGIRAWAEGVLQAEGELGSVNQSHLLQIAATWIPIMEKRGDDVTALKQLFNSLGEKPSAEDLSTLAANFKLRYDPEAKDMPETYDLPEWNERRRMMEIAGLTEAQLKDPLRQHSSTRLKHLRQLVGIKQRRIDALVSNERTRLINEYVEKLRQEAKTAAEARRKVTPETIEQKEQGTTRTDEEISAQNHAPIAEDAEHTMVQDTINELYDELADDPNVKPEEPKSAVDRVIAAIESLKVDETRYKDAKYSGFPPAVWNSLIDLVTSAIRGGVRLYEAVDRTLTGLTAYPNREVRDEAGRIVRKPILHEREALMQIMRWMRLGQTTPESLEALNRAVKYLEKYAKPAIVYRTARSEHFRGVGGWTTDKRAANDIYYSRYGHGLNERKAKMAEAAEEDRATWEKLSPEQKKKWRPPSRQAEFGSFIAFKAQRVIDADTLESLGEELTTRFKDPELKQAINDAQMYFDAEKEAYVLDHILTPKQAEEMKVAIFDKVSELRTGAMLDPEEFAKDIGPMIAASVNLDGFTARAAMHAIATDELWARLGGFSTDKLRKSQSSYDGFITKTQRHVTRKEAELLSGASESIMHQHLYGPESLGAVDAKLSDIAEALGDDIDLVEGSRDIAAFAKNYPRVLHKQMILDALANHQPVSAKAVNDYAVNFKVPADYKLSANSQFYLPSPTGTEAWFSPVLQDKLVMDALERCIIK